MYKHTRSRLSGAALALAAGLTNHTAGAAGDYPFYFQLDFAQQRIPLEGGTGLEANTFGLSYREYLSQDIGLELHLGRLGVEHEGDSTAMGFDPTGYYAGLGFDARTPERQRLQGGIDLRYSYYHSGEDVAADTLELDWTQGEARLWATLRLSQRFKLYACAFALSVDGDQELDGTAVAEQSLENADDSGECAGLILETADDGRVGIEAYGGARQGGRIYFGKYFW